MGGNFAILGRDEESDYVDVFGKDYSKNVEVGLWRKLSAEELMLLNCGVGEDSWESLGLQGKGHSPFVGEKNIFSTHTRDQILAQRASSCVTLSSLEWADKEINHTLGGCAQGSFWYSPQIPHKENLLMIKGKLLNHWEQVKACHLSFSFFWGGDLFGKIVPVRLQLTAKQHECNRMWY